MVRRISQFYLRLAFDLYLGFYLKYERSGLLEH